MIKKIFKKEYPIIGVIHLKPLPSELDSPGMEALKKQVVDSVKIFEKAGVDGILVENESDKPHTITITKAQVAAMTILTDLAVRTSSVPVGVTCLLLDWEADFAVAKATGARFVRLNVFVDDVMREPSTWGSIDIEARKPIFFNPMEIQAYRQGLGAQDIALFVDIHVKYMQMLEPDKTIGESAEQAEFYGADAIIVSGSRTGKPTSKKDITEAKAACSIPVFIGSGLNSDTIEDLLPAADGSIVGSAFEKEGNLDQKATSTFMKNVEKLRSKGSKKS